MLRRVSLGEMQQASAAQPAKEEPLPEKGPSLLPVVIIVVALIVVLAIVAVVYISVSGL